MKKVIGLCIVAAAAFAGWHYTQNDNELKLSDLALENVEALANGEGMDQYGYKLVNNCCKAHQPREYACSSIWPDC